MLNSNINITPPSIKQYSTLKINKILTKKYYILMITKEDMTHLKFFNI